MSETIKSNKKNFLTKILSLVIKQSTVLSVLILILAVVFGGKHFFQFKKVSKEVKNKISQEEETLKNREEELSQIKDLLRNYQKTKEEIKDLELFLPRKKDLPGIFVSLERIAEASELKINSISVSEEAKKENVGVSEKTKKENEKKIDSKEPKSKLKEVKIALSVQGESYEILKKFLDNIEKNIRLLDINSINFGSLKGKITNYTISLKTYYLE